MSAAQESTNRAKLATAVDKLYDVFTSPVPPIIVGCPCCIDTRGADILLSKPLRGLSGKEMWRYISGAYLTIGSDRDFRYLLPRIFELSAQVPSEVPDAEIVLGKLARANWTTWAVPEQNAVREFVDAWFNYAIEQDLKYAADEWIGDQTESVLCGAAHAGMSLSGWLRQLLNSRNALLLNDLRERYPHRMSAFWEDVPDDLEELSVVLAQGSA